MAMEFIEIEYDEKIVGEETYQLKGISKKFLNIIEHLIKLELEKHVVSKNTSLRKIGDNSGCATTNAISK